MFSLEVVFNNTEAQRYKPAQHQKWLRFHAKTYFQPREIEATVISGRNMFKLTIDPANPDNAHNFYLLAQLLMRQQEVQSVTITKLQMSKSLCQLHLRY